MFHMKENLDGSKLEQKKQIRKFNFEKFTRKLAKYELNRVKEVLDWYNNDQLIISDDDRKRVICLYSIIQESLRPQK